MDDFSAHHNLSSFGIQDGEISWELEDKQLLGRRERFYVFTREGVNLDARLISRKSNFMCLKEISKSYHMKLINQ